MEAEFFQIEEASRKKLIGREGLLPGNDSARVIESAVDEQGKVNTGSAWTRLISTPVTGSRHPSALLHPIFICPCHTVSACLRFLPAGI